MNSDGNISTWYGKTEDKRKDYSILRAVEKGLLYFFYYIIILAFIGAFLKFIRTIAIELVKGLLGILGLLYNNSRSARKGEESKQPINPRSSPNIGDTILTLTLTTLRADGP